jgi:hypothetical protein
MKRWCLPVMVSALSCFVIACTPLKLLQVREGLNETISELPQSEDFKIITTLSGEFYDSSGGVTCHWAGANVAVGTPLAAGNALEAYIEELQAQGWVLERNDMRGTNLLVRGKHEVLWVAMGPPSLTMELEDSYQMAQSRYSTFLHPTVQYYLPGWEECLLDD